MHVSQYWDIYFYCNCVIGVARCRLQDTWKDVRARRRNSSQIYAYVLSDLQAIDNFFQLRTLDCNTDNQISGCPRALIIIRRIFFLQSQKEIVFHYDKITFFRQLVAVKNKENRRIN